MIDFLSTIDTQLLLWINSFNTPALDQFMWLLSHKLVWVPMYLITIALVFNRFGLKRGLMIIIGVALAVTLADQTCATIIRPLVQRMRPANPDNPISTLVHIVNGYRGGRYGFPSCHAANTFAVATYLSYVFRRRTLVVWSLFLWAAFNCYSRMYLGVHYPGDIIVGAMIGSIMGYVSYRIILRLSRMAFRAPSRPFSDSVSISLGNFMPQIELSNSVLICAAGLITTCILLSISLISYFV